MKNKDLRFLRPELLAIRHKSIRQSVIVLVVNVQEGVVPLDREVAQRLRLAGKPVLEALEPESPLVLPASTTADVALQQLLAAHGHCLVVEEDGWVLALVTLEDLQRPISAGLAEQPLRDCRRSDLIWLSVEANLAQLEDQLSPNGLRQLPVFQLQDPGLPKLPVGVPSTGLPVAGLQGLASRDGMARALARLAMA